MGLRDLGRRMTARGKALKDVRKAPVQESARRHVEDMMNNLEFRKQALLVFYFVQTKGTKSMEAVDALNQLLEEFDLSFFSLNLLWNIIMEGGPDSIDDALGDVCAIEHDWLELVNRLPSGKDRDVFELIKAMKYRAYPVSIAISASSSQRNVMEFIRRHWKEIEAAQRQIIPNPTRTRMRPKAKRDELVLRRPRSSARAIRGELKRQGLPRILDDEGVYAVKKKLRKRFRKGKIK